MERKEREKMVYELTDTTKAEPIFAGWEETLIYSCIQQIMGKVYVTDVNQPASACAFVGCFVFFAGDPDEELIRNKPDGFVIMVPQNQEWANLIEKSFPTAKKVTRYAIRKDTEFDIAKLQDMVKMLPAGYELKEIDGQIYDKCLEKSVTADFVAAFGSKEKYLEYGRGMVIMKEGEIVSGASSYTRYREGIEMEVDTIEPERRKQLATIVCAALILKCLAEHLYPSWDAQNINSVHLAEKLGYVYSHEYAAYEVSDE